MDTITYLGHVVSYNLDDTSDIIRATKDMTRKANFAQSPHQVQEGRARRDA